MRSNPNTHSRPLWPPTFSTVRPQPFLLVQLSHMLSFLLVNKQVSTQKFTNSFTFFFVHFDCKRKIVVACQQLNRSPKHLESPFYHRISVFFSRPNKHSYTNAKKIQGRFIKRYSGKTRKQSKVAKKTRVVYCP